MLRRLNGSGELGGILSFAWDEGGYEIYKG